MAVLCIAILISCTRDNEDENQYYPLAFNCDIDNNMITRATVDEALINGFFVYGYKTLNDNIQTVFNGYHVMPSGDEWNYIGINGQYAKYWDLGASEYSFFGLTSNADVNVVSNEANVSFLIDASDENTPYVSDIWNEEHDEFMGNIGVPVKLIFRRPLCKIRFLLVDENGNEYHVENPQFGPSDSNGKIVTKGIITLKYPLKGETEYTWDISSYETIKDNVFTEEGKWHTVIPVFDQDSYTMKVPMGNEIKEATVPKEYMQWKLGYSYTYTFKVTDSGDVQFINISDVAVKKWKDAGVTNHNIYNW